MNTFSHTNRAVILDSLNELPNWSVPGHICMGKSVNRRNDKLINKYNIISYQGFPPFFSPLTQVQKQ